MSMDEIDFIRGPVSRDDENNKNFNLFYTRPKIDVCENADSVLTTNNKTPRESRNKTAFVEDGLYASDDPFTRNVMKPHVLNHTRMLNYESTPKFCGKLVEIAVREVKMHSTDDPDASNLEITSVSLLFKKKAICKSKRPFNRKLYKLLVRNSECHNLAIQVRAQHGKSSILPLPLPRRCIKDSRVEIDFAISDHVGKIHSGTVTCTVSVNSHGSSEQMENTLYLYKLSNDPNDPQNSLSLLRPRTSACKKKVKYFTLQDTALRFDVGEQAPIVRKTEHEEPKPPDVAVTEEPVFSLLDISFRNLFRARRPLMPSSGTRRHHTMGKACLAVTILRGVEVPVREESAIVQPLVEVEWGNTSHTTTVADGPAPIWQQTMHFEVPRQNSECCVKIRLFDQHPVWGQQWLGEAKIPLEYHRNYQELERWITLSPLYSPVLSFGYVQASPGYSYTRIYILMKMEQPGNPKSIEDSGINTLSKGIQRCLTAPYKVNGVESPVEAARLARLLSHLPVHYGPLTPRQALNISKVDHYGRAVLLATLLQGFGYQVYVLLGSSQTSRWSAFVLSINENRDTELWDPEIGEHYNLNDSRCSLTRVCRLINHCGVWENLQKSILPHNLKYDVSTSKDWRPVGTVSSSTTSRPVQTLEINATPEDEVQQKDLIVEMEQYLQDKMSQWRSSAGLTTMFNRHAVNVLRKFISKAEESAGQHLDKRELTQLYRAYHTHGFILNLRKCSLDELAEQLASTKAHNATGPVEFALACHQQRYVGKTCSIWLALAILRNRD